MGYRRNMLLKFCSGEGPVGYASQSSEDGFHPSGSRRTTRGNALVAIAAACALSACGSEEGQSSGAPEPSVAQQSPSAVPSDLAAQPSVPSNPAPPTGTTPPTPVGTGPSIAPDPPAPGATAPPPTTVNSQPPPPGSGTAPIQPEPAVTAPAGIPAATQEGTLLGDVALSTPSQSFVGQLEVGLSTSVDNAEIRYTTDGTLPTSTSTPYGGTPLLLEGTTQIRAQAFVDGAPSGFMTTGLYIARTFEATSNLPIMLIDSYGSGKPTNKEVYFQAAVMVFEPSDGSATLSALPTLATRAGYHIRGQSSASFPQTPYKVEFWDNRDADVDYPLLGMGEDSDWALIPPYYDRTLIRNPFVYELGREMGLQAPHWVYAEVYLNFDGGPVTEEHYQGIYWLTETLKNNKVRTDLAQLDESVTNAPEISGGYIFKFDQAAAEEPLIACTGAPTLPPFSFGGFGRGGQGADPTDPPEEMEEGTCWLDLELVDPDPPNEQQVAWLANYLQTFHDGLHATPMADYSTHIDVASFVDYLIVNELSFNVDAYVRSAYYHKDRDGLLTAGPLWDYNFALGGVGAQTAVPESDEQTGFRFSGTRNVNNWYQRLTSDAGFMAQVRARYDELRGGLLSDAAVEQRMDELTAPLSEAIARDFAKWPVEDIITSETGFLGGPTAPTWEGQVQVMHDFLIDRLNWMDTSLP